MSRKPRAESRPPTKREKRPRPTPKWLLKSTDLDAIAKARVLMVLSVLSGEKPVTAAIEELAISRGFYYQLETRAINAMLIALTPGSDADARTDGTESARRIADLENKVGRAERDRRRAERLLFLTRKVIGPVSVKTAAGRPPKAANWTTGGRKPSRGSSTEPKLTKPRSAPTAASIPTPAGASADP